MNYHAELIYGIRLGEVEGELGLYVNEMLLKEYALESAHNRIITVNPRVFVHLPCYERSEMHSLNQFRVKDCDDRLHRYASDVGLTDYDIGWHVYLPKTEAPEKEDIATFINVRPDGLVRVKIDPEKINWVGTDTGRSSMKEPNLPSTKAHWDLCEDCQEMKSESCSHSCKKAYAEPEIKTVPLPEKKISFTKPIVVDDLIAKYFAAEDDRVSRVIVLEGESPCNVRVDELVDPGDGTWEGDAIRKEETLHSTTFGDLIDHGDGTWTAKYWRRGGSKLAKPLKLTVKERANHNDDPGLWVFLGSLRLGVYQIGSSKEAVLNALNDMFTTYREARRHGFATPYEKILCKLIVDDDLQSGAGDRETKTWKFEEGIIQRRAGDRWFIMSWKQGNLELIKPLEAKIVPQTGPTFSARCDGFLTDEFVVSTPQGAVVELAKRMFGRYTNLIEFPNLGGERRREERLFFADKIRQMSVEEEAVIGDAAEQIAEKIDTDTKALLEELPNHPDIGPEVLKESMRLTTNRFVKHGYIPPKHKSRQDLIAEIKADLEKPLKE